ncbi:MAG: DUF1566 domain-containing protein [Campylobacterota bacterium]
MLKFVLSVALLFMIGCGVAEKKAPIIKDEPTYTLMYVKVDREPFIKSEQVKVFRIVEGIATTSKGEIDSRDLEDKRSEFRLYVNSPNAQKIRILNIQPKYRDGIWLKSGKYHVEISAKKHITHKEWISLEKDTNFTIALKRKQNVSLGFVKWKSQVGIKYIDGRYWQDQAINKKKKMNWDDAKNYCQNLVITNGKVNIDDFTLPTESELLSLSKHNSELDYAGSICWSSSSDKEHTNFAKYVYINSKKNGWYNKEGVTYVRCVSRRNYPQKLTLSELTKHISKEQGYKYIDALESAVQIKYGKPIVKNVIYNSKKKNLSFTLKSQKYDSKKNYFYDKVHTIPMKFHPKSLKLNPVVEFEVINDKLIFKTIKSS